MAADGKIAGNLAAVDAVAIDGERLLGGRGRHLMGGPGPERPPRGRQHQAQDVLGRLTSAELDE